MAKISRLLADDRSVIDSRHAATASVWAAVSVVAGIFLTVAGSKLYEESSQRVLWALAHGCGPLAG